MPVKVQLRVPMTLAQQRRLKFRFRRRQTKHNGSMNRWESAWAAQLEGRVLAGELVAYRFEAFKLRLADNTFYTPDFLVLCADGVIEFHEVKGHWRDDARVKIKVAAEQYPWFGFVAATRKSQRHPWQVEVFG